MEPEADFPAAHSMDTTWFAVDRDGHVACFRSGEAGAVPEAAGADEEGDLLPQLLRGLPAGHPALDLMTWVGEGEGSEERHRDWDGDGPDWDFTWNLLFLESLEALRGPAATQPALLPGVTDPPRGGSRDHLQIISYPAPVGVAVLVQGLKAAVARRLHTSGACLGCFGPFEPAQLPELFGLYHYGHTCENWISGPYAREGTPRRPIVVDDLAPEVRALVGGMQFDRLCFAEAERIQPVDHAPCASWESAYLDLDGTTVRAIPGREDEYREAYEEWSEEGGEDGDGLRFEPPPPAPGGR